MDVSEYQKMDETVMNRFPLMKILLQKYRSRNTASNNFTRYENNIPLMRCSRRINILSFVTIPYIFLIHIKTTLIRINRIESINLNKGDVNLINEPLSKLGGKLGTNLFVILRKDLKT